MSVKASDRGQLHRMPQTFLCKADEPQLGRANIRVELRPRPQPCTDCITWPKATLTKQRSGRQLQRFVRTRLRRTFLLIARIIRQQTMSSGAITSRRATSRCAAQPLTIRRMRQRITAASARTHPSPGIHACRRRSARVPRSVWLEHLSRTRRLDWLQAIGAW